MGANVTFPAGTRRQQGVLARVRAAAGAGAGVLARRGGRLLRVALLLLPTIVAAAYFLGVATDRYVSEARFVIRTAAKPANPLGGLASLLQLVGLSRSQDDAYAVHDFLTSRDAVQQLRERMDLEAVYEHPEADFLTRYPSIIYDSTQEEFFRYFQRMLEVTVSTTSGLTTLEVQAFSAEDAQKVARGLLELGEELVNRLNQRMQADAVRVATAEVEKAEERRIANQVAVTAFRNKELLLDPNRASVALIELVGKLSGALADVRAQIAELGAGAPNSPQLGPLRQRAAALDQQIQLERGRAAASSDGLADKMAEYERLMLGREFAIRALAQAVAAQEAAATEARRQQLFLERVVEPGLPDKPTRPRRWQLVATVFGFNLIGIGVFWLVATGFREHAQRAH